MSDPSHLKWWEEERCRLVLYVVEVFVVLEELSFFLELVFFGIFYSSVQIGPALHIVFDAFW